MNHPQSPSSDDKAKPSLLRRIPLAFGALFGVLADADLAARYAALRDGAALPPAPATAAPVPAPPVLKEASPDAALQLLALLQRDARLIDFVGEDLGGYADAQIGAAARLVHEGCAKVLREHFSIVPVRDEAEGSRVTLQAGFDAAAVRLTGNVVGQPPFTGSLEPPRLARHRGAAAQAGRAPRRAACWRRRRSSCETRAALRDRHRPRHHAQRAGLSSTSPPATAKPPSHGVLPIPQLTAPGAVESLPLLPSFLYLPHADEMAAGDLALPWSADSRACRRRTGAQPRRDDADPAGLEREELALPPRRRPARRDPAARCAARGGAGVAARRLDPLPRTPARRLGPCAPRSAVRRAGRDGDDPGVVRPRRARADGRSGQGRRLQFADAARRAASGAVQLDRGQRRRLAQAGAGRATSSWSSTSAAAPATSR